MQYSGLLHTRVKLKDSQRAKPWTYCSWTSRIWLTFYDTCGIKTRESDSGDLPFLMKLVLGITNESMSPSKMPLYNGPSLYTPTNCHQPTGLRSNAIVHFRMDLPKTSLVLHENVKSVCPDTTHMTFRYVYLRSRLNKSVFMPASRTIEQRNFQETGWNVLPNQNLDIRASRFGTSDVQTCGKWIYTKTN